MKRPFAFTASLVMGILGFFLGREVERFRNDEACVYPLSLYSKHLCTLAVQQRIGELTNDVIVFDNKFSQKRVIDYALLAEILKNSVTNRDGPPK